MRDTTLQTFRRDTVFTVKIVGVFKTETRRGRNKNLTTWTRERNGVNLTLTFTTSTGDTTGMGSLDKKCLLIVTNSDLHDVLRSNWQTGLLSGTNFLDIGRRVFEKGVTVVVLEICLLNINIVECNLETVDSGGKSGLLNTKETAILYDFLN